MTMPAFIGLAEVSIFGIVLIVVSIPLALGWVPRNRLYGFRVPATLRTDAVWYAINRRFAREAIVVGAVLAVLAASLDAAGFDTRAARAIANVALLGSLLLMTVRGWRAANRMERSQ